MPYNQVAHDFLLEQGYTHHHEKATWEEVGDAENGPKVDGGPACDVYGDKKDYVIVDENGAAWFEEGAAAMDIAYEKMEADWAKAAC
jgi:hypothetical protein